jgi:hypothetical protein
MVANRRKIGILFNPYFVTVTLTERPIQAVDRLISLPKERIGARNVVKDRRFFGVHGPGTIGPFKGTGTLAKFAKRV